MIRKIVLAFILVILLAVVSYVKTVREEHKINQKLLAHQIEQKNDAQSDLFNDTLQKPDELNTERIDSMVTKITGDKTAIEKINNNGQEQLAQHQQIYKFYTQRYAALDQSLTVSEKETALNKLKEETIQKYSISAVDLDNIRKLYKLDY